MALSRTDGFSDEVQAWLAECLPRALAYARSSVRDSSEADDVVQQCVYRRLKRGTSYDLPRDGSRLLFRAMTNECINRTMRGSASIGLDAPDHVGCLLGHSIGDSRAEQPVEIVLTNELREILDAALGRLPVAQRAAVQLKSLGYSLEEIADSLSITANHAGVLVHRARQAIREEIAEYMGERRI
jgi:RNA polymerase sigma-70 factor (ECF subfamily)